ncbi:flavodoxin family protein [candidate division WWE3 bacterium]|uniref:Flavodoxin family protein n=1 Tax=candidate division WWE3 bacterium TaxID=2053526 RepID=A0A7X9E7N7_UNCKA|nr:flavodoxin family protein [candidate division WWE3 bacterium]
MKVLSICGSPRKGNSETLVLFIQDLLKKKGVDNEVVLLRTKNIKHCGGCVEFCNKNLKCLQKDDMNELVRKMEQADGFVFVCPNYFSMPPGIFKDFIDRCSVLYTANKQDEFGKKKAIVICVGAEEPEYTDACTNNVAQYCETLGMNVVGRKSIRSRSELQGNYNYVLETPHNKGLKEEIEELVNLL